MFEVNHTEFRVCRSVGLLVTLSVCPLVTNVYYRQTVDSIETPFGVIGLVGSRNNILDGSPDRAREWGKFWGNGWPSVTYRENVAPSLQKQPT